MPSPKAPSGKLSIIALGMMLLRALINKFSNVELGTLSRKALLAGSRSARSA